MLSAQERIGYMRRFMALNSLRIYKRNVENEIAKWECRLKDMPSEASREQMKFHQILLGKIEKVIAEKENRAKEVVA